MLKVLIMGPAGSGKGTMSELICEQYKIQHISTGDMFREEFKNNTPLGQEAKVYIDKGLLVPDGVTIAMVKARLTREDCANGYLLDGFPRSLAQAEAIEDLNVNAVINLTIDESQLVHRIVDRRLCRGCGAIYNITSNPSKVEGVCDICGGELYQRSDDTIEKLQTRLESYANETQPVIDYYRQKGVVIDVDASKKVEEVFQQIEDSLTNLLKEIN